MKAMILAAGLGTRLKPWTNEHPKALVPVNGDPMLKRVISKLLSQGFNEIILNVHHFADQIINYVSSNNLGVKSIKISNESDKLLDTGGGILKASSLFNNDNILIHNVDILSNADLSQLMKHHILNGNDVTLLTSNRDSSRKLIFDLNSNLIGWHNIKQNLYKPEALNDDFLANSFKQNNYSEFAFSGIYVISPNVIPYLEDYSAKNNTDSFPIMDFLLTLPPQLKIKNFNHPELKLIDIGKPDALARAADLLKEF